MLTLLFILGLCRESCCTVPRGQGRPSWPVPWPTTQNVPLSECQGQNWCRSSSGRDPGWCGSSSLWPGNSGVLMWRKVLGIQSYRSELKSRWIFIIFFKKFLFNAGMKYIIVSSHRLKSVYLAPSYLWLFDHLEHHFTWLCNCTLNV